MKMKTEPSHEDPISAAAAVLLRAMDHAKRAVSESQAMCGILAAKIKDLEDAMKLQGADLDARALSAKRDLGLMLADRYRGMVESQKKLESVLALSTRLETKVTDKDGTIADLLTQLLSVRSAVAMERSRPRFSPVDPPELATSLPVGAFMAQGISLAQVGAVFATAPPKPSSVNGNLPKTASVKVATPPRSSAKYSHRPAPKLPFPSRRSQRRRVHQPASVVGSRLFELKRHFGLGHSSKCSKYLSRENVEFSSTKVRASGEDNLTCGLRAEQPAWLRVRFPQSLAVIRGFRNKSRTATCFSAVWLQKCSDNYIAGITICGDTLLQKLLKRTVPPLGEMSAIDSGRSDLRIEIPPRALVSHEGGMNRRSRASIVSPVGKDHERRKNPQNDEPFGFSRVFHEGGMNLSPVAVSESGRGNAEAINDPEGSLPPGSTGVAAYDQIMESQIDKSYSVHRLSLKNWNMLFAKSEVNIQRRRDRNPASAEENTHRRSPDPKPGGHSATFVSYTASGHTAGDEVTPGCGPSAGWIFAHFLAACE
ncbi:hypothetical protein B0H13DRAFT_1863429 [Mycena leptocephala]|nr:hypothetical protein B0H13DRAFT_1863429 [Mycena leptocephala]